MKKKYLKKMLAIMLASMTVAATPGLVGAMREESRNAIKTVNEQVANQSLKKEDAISKLDELEKIANEDDDAKKEVAKILGKMITEGLFDRPDVENGYYPPGVFEELTCPPEYLSKIINILKICSSCVDAREDVAKAVKNMASKDLLGRASDFYSHKFISQCSPEQFSGIIDILDICLNDDNYETQQKDYAQTKQHVAEAILNMAFKGVFGESDLWGNRSAINIPDDEENYELGEESSRKCSGEQLFKIMQFLNKCLHGNEITVAKSIRDLNIKGLLNEYSNTQILNMLRECLKNPDAKKQVAYTIRGLIDNELCVKNSINQILDILKLCFDNNEYIMNDISHAIYCLFEQNLFESDSLNSILDILAKCSNCDKARNSVMRTAEEIIQQDLLNQNELYKIQQMINLLMNLSKDDGFKIQVFELILTMGEKELLKQCNPDQIRQIVGTLTGLLGGDDIRERGITTIASMIQKHNVLDKLDDAQIQKLIDSLPDSLANNDTQEAAIIIFAAMAEHDMLNKFNDAQIQKLIDSLQDALGNNNTQEAATIILSAMAEHDMLNEFNDDQIQQILNLFRDQLEIYLAAGNYEMVDKIFKVLKACSEMDDLKENVANIAYNLVTNSDFYQYLNQNVSKPRLRNILEVSMSCSKAQDNETRAKALFAIADVIHNVGSTVALTEIAADQIEQKIPQIIEILEESSMVDDAKFHVSDIINLLGRRGFFQNLTHGQSRRLIQALDNCLTYGGERITTAGNLNEAQQNIATHVCSIFNGDTSWLIAFRAGLLPDDEARLNQLQNDAWAAEGNAYANM